MATTTRRTRTARPATGRTTSKARATWTPAQIKELRACVKRRMPAPQIANRLKRTPTAIRQKCQALGISLRAA